MVFIIVFVIYVSYVYALSVSSFISLNLVFFAMVSFCAGVFMSNNLFCLYLFYESSLLPILYIIINWGSYPERSLSAIMLLIYTAVFTFPFIAVIFSVYYLNNSFMLLTYALVDAGSLSSLFSFIIFLTFAVKLPIYGLHFWLPMAHVEAPTFGSMILAGVLLKLGGVGLLRCLPLLDTSVLYSYLISYFMVFILYVTVVCLFQSDFKRLVAYSSVSHMMAIPILIIANNVLSTKVIVLAIFLHGLSSPILFMLVGVIYSIFSSRQLVVIRGIILISPLLGFIMVLAFFFTVSAPPFPSFVSEVYFMVASLSLTPYLIFTFLIFTFLSIVYNLNWLSSMLFSSATPSNMSVTLTYAGFMPMFLSLVLCVPISLLMVMMLW